MNNSPGIEKNSRVRFMGKFRAFLQTNILPWGGSLEQDGKNLPLVLPHGPTEAQSKHHIPPHIWWLWRTSPQFSSTADHLELMGHLF